MNWSKPFFENKILSLLVSCVIFFIGIFAIYAAGRVLFYVIDMTITMPLHHIVAFFYGIVVWVLVVGGIAWINCLIGGKYHARD